MKSEKTHFFGLIVLAFTLILIHGQTAGAYNNYIEETSASTAVPDNSQMADVSSLMAAEGAQNQASVVSIALQSSTIQENTIQASEPASTDYIESFKPDQVIEYTVKTGDNVGSIAADFGVSVNTIIWANNIRNPNALSLGQVLKIPPVTGVIHTVKTGDTAASIAKLYNASESKILAFNDLQDNQALTPGDQLMVPDGELPGPKPVVKAPIPRAHGIYVPVGDGQCVAFVQAHGYANLHGNAYQWARYINTNGPAAGAVVVLRGGRFGHVALITAVKDTSIQVVEQNYYGLYVIDHREISLGDRSIVGFIQ